MLVKGAGCPVDAMSQVSHRGTWYCLRNVGTFSVDPDSKVHGANMGPIWGRQDPGGLHVGPMNFALWVEAWLEISIIFNTTPMDYNYKFYDFIINLLVTIISAQYH